MIRLFGTDIGPKRFHASVANSSEQDEAPASRYDSSGTVGQPQTEPHHQRHGPERTRAVSDSFSERVLRVICPLEPQLTLLFTGCLLLFVLTVASLLVLESDTPAYAVSLLNLVGIAVLGSVAGGLVLLCKRRE